MNLGFRRRDSISELTVTPKCSRCRKEIPRDDVNVSNDVAYCRGCNLAHSLSALVLGLSLDANVDTQNPPAGAWFHGSGTDVVFGATQRSFGAMVGSFAFALFWNGITSVFVLCAISDTLRNLDMSIPDWFPAPKMNGEPMSVGTTIFLWIFLTPFILVGATMIGYFLSTLAGRTEVRIQDGEGMAFTGIGPIGLRRRFDTRAVKDVRVEDKTWRDQNSSNQQIVIETAAGRRIKFGSLLREDRMKFVAAVARRLLLVDRRK